jgi:hemin uptake protein HemP
MTAPLPPVLNPPKPADGASPRLVTSESLLEGQRELLIQHGADQYRLRLTTNNKLILVK